MLEQDVKKRVDSWLHGPFDEGTKREIERLLKEAPGELSDAFFKELSFGTGGMRGLMGVGTNRLNIYTIRIATQGLANYLLGESKPTKGHSIFIGYDVRNHSKEFAEEAAKVLAGNGIRVLISKEICPTPLVSYGCRLYGCSGAIMITASHNPPKYNGYKVYWSDGGQVVYPRDTGIMDEVKKIKGIEEVKMAPLDSPLITFVGKELDHSYLQKIHPLQLYPKIPNDKLKVLYTPLHGTGIRIIPEALNSWGFSDVSLVKLQATQDPLFSHAPSPNPEEAAALELGSKELINEKKDILIATDPDADRVGLVALDKGKPYRFTGHQIACLCLYHICTTLELRGEIPVNGAVIKTIVTTELFRAIAESFRVECIDVLTGFKYIGEQMTLWEKSFDAKQFLFGAEESYGYLLGTHVRDKDAIIASCLIAEAASFAKKQNLTLVDRLYQLYEKYGVHREALASLTFPDSAAGMEKMNELMKKLRKEPPSKINGQKIVSIEDYKTGVSKNLLSLEETPLTLPSSDVLRFWLEDKTKLVIRPSGTEPKVKIYAEVISNGSLSIEKEIELTDQRIKQLIESIKSL